MPAETRSLPCQQATALHEADTAKARLPTGYGHAIRAHRPVRAAWGSMKYPYQIFITAYRPALPAIPYVAGYGSPVGGYGTGTITYADITDAQDAVSDADIYARVASVVGAGITAWVDIE